MARPHTHGGDNIVCTLDDENLSTVPIEPEHIRIYDADGKNYPHQGIDLEWLQSGGEVIVLDRAEDRTKFYTDFATKFLRWMTTNTDTFDKVVVQVMINNDDDLGFNDEEATELAESFVAVMDDSKWALDNA